MIYAYGFAALEAAIFIFVLGMLAGAALGERYDRRHQRDAGWNIEADFARLDANGRIKT